MNQADSRFRLTTPLARELASKFGTPLYVLDEQSIRNRVQQYRDGLDANYRKTELSFASKANSTLAVLKIVHQEGATIDVASEGELRAALKAGVPASHCHLHGNNKKAQEILFALDQGIAMIVVDHLGEIEMIANLIKGRSYKTTYLLRLAPGVDPKTHARISTGQSDTKFGFNIANGAAEEALLRALDLGLPIVGIHCHVGSQLLDDEAQSAAGDFLASFAVDMKEKHGFLCDHIIVGGGLGVKYTAPDEPLAIREYCQRVINAMKPVLNRIGIEPIIGMEPGRSIVGEAGVTLYTVGVVKTVPIAEGKERVYVAVDGGLSDNPRPAMYEAKYDLELIAATDRPPQNTKLVTVCGKHCETDNLFVDVEIQNDVAIGDYIQVLSTGAYNSTMANNYNRYVRPATVLIRQNGTYEQVVRRDSWEEMFDKESIPGDL